jgi:hypothetical protein
VELERIDRASVRVVSGASVVPVVQAESAESAAPVVPEALAE